MDLECPYCGEGLDICHDDGFGYEEGVLHEMECKYCEKIFVFQTSISYNYESKKADCLNDEQHNWKLSSTYPRELSEMVCTMCGERRELTDEERSSNNIGTLENFWKLLKESN